MDIEILSSGSKGNCYKVKTSDTTLLIECGISFKEIQKKLNFKVNEIDACLITHSHKDHSHAVNEIMKAGIDCYMSKGTAEELNLSGHRLKTFTRLKNVNMPYMPLSIINKSLTIQAFNTIHDTKEPIGFVVMDIKTNENLVFITDTAYVPYIFDRIDYLMIECNYVKSTLDSNVTNGHIDINLRNRIVKNHMSLETVIGFLKSNDLSYLKKMYVLHLSESNSDENIIKEEIQKVTGKSIYIC